MNSQISVLVDWLTFSTRSYIDPFDVIRNYLGLDPDLFEARYGLMFYTKSLYYKGISVYFEPSESASNFEDMGICVSMSGLGCRTFDCYSNLTFSQLFQLIADDDTSICSRVDLACDDHFGLLDLDLISDCIVEGRVRSRLSKFSIIQSFVGGVNAKTIYLGSEKSSYRCRIYDKAKERNCASKEVWNRFEIVLKDHYSDQFIDLIQSMDLGSFISSFLKEKLDFINLDDSNISRCSVCSWWSDFVSQFQDISFSIDKNSSDDILKKEEYFIYQLAPTFSLLYDALGFDFFHLLYHQGLQRRSKRKQALLDSWRSSYVASAR